jgi:hypothetical protein
MYVLTLKQWSRKSLASGDSPGGRGGPAVALCMASMTANWLSMSGQGCLPLSISSTVQPSDQMSALRPAARDKVAGVGDKVTSAATMVWAFVVFVCCVAATRCLPCALRHLTKQGQRRSCLRQAL